LVVLLWQDRVIFSVLAFIQLCYYFYKMKIRCFLLALLSAYTVTAQDSLTFRKISDEIMLHSTCYENLRVLCKTVGNRISGSPAAAKAVELGNKAMKEVGPDKVWLQPADVPYWYRGKESLYLTLDGDYQKVTMTSLGNSEGTGGNDQRTGYYGARF
jgi:hypothetical protein